MISVVVISKDAPFTESVRKQLSNHNAIVSSYKSFTFADAREHEHCDLCVLNISDWNDTATTIVDRTRQLLPESQLFVVGSQDTESWEDDAYSHGADYVAQAPFHQPLLKAILSSQNVSADTRQTSFMNYSSTSLPDPMPGYAQSKGPDLETLRDLSRILSHSLDYESLVKHFALKVREIVGVNRIAVFLESPHLPLLSSVPRYGSRLNCVCTVGIPADVQQCFELSQRSGIGGWVIRQGQILRQELASSAFSPAENVKVQREFDILNCQVAIPINDREKTIGVALLGGHLTRIGFSDEELQLLFHLMEELGLSVKNCWLHQQLSWNNDLFNQVFSALHSGSMVVSPDLDIIKANPAIIEFLGGSEANAIEFSDLPGSLATQIHGAVEEREVPAPFFISLPGDSEDRLFRITMIPLQSGPEKGSQPIMIVMEDFTEIEAAKKSAVEASNLRLTALIAKRFAHETRNSLVPLTTHLQLFDERFEQEGFRESLQKALKEETGRISRFTEQMLFLSQPPVLPGNVIPLEKLIRESFDEAQQHAGFQGILDLRDLGNCPVRCHPPSLKMAFQEIFMNALQSAGDNAQVTVSANFPANRHKNTIALHFRDNGPGLSPEVARQAHEAFFTTRNTGIGLGLTLVRKILEDHDGHLDIRARETSESDIVATLPAESISHD